MAFREGVRSWRSALKAVYAAHEHLFEMNQAVTALKIDQAFEQMQADEQEMATVEGKVEKAGKLWSTLLLGE